MKRFASVVLAFVLAIGLFPPTALAALAPGEAPLRATAATESVRDVQRVVSQTLGEHDRTVPAAADFHEAFGVEYGYPAYDGDFDAKVKAAGGDVAAQKAAVLAEDEALLDYTALDAEGNYYKDGVRKQASPDGRTVVKLVRHTAGVANYGASIPDTAKSTGKRLSVRMVRYGNVVTGLYAPPGEVVKVTLRSTSAEKDAKDLGLKALVGNFSGNKHQVTIPSDRTYVRMPQAEKELALDREVNYIGSPFGGAILIYSSGIGGTTVEMDIEGAVEMPTYDYGETTDEELARQLAAPGPYFAFSTPRGIRAVGPASLVRGLTAEQVRRAMEFWDKAIGVSYQFGVGGFDKTDQDTNVMVEMFEPHIPAGAAVNMGGAYCICPVSWGNSFLDADGLMTGGAWGDIHELNHSFYWGGALDGSVEIANNVISALTYQLYTNIAAARTEAGGLTGWNWCADAFNALENTRKRTNNYGTLGVYVPFQHAFGADAFIDAVRVYHESGGKAGKLAGNARQTNANVWMYATAEASGYDTAYYMRDILGSVFPLYDGMQASDYLTADVVGEVRSRHPNVWIPSGCLYASGYVYGADSGDEKVVEMGRPFRIPYGKAKLLNFHSSADGGYVSVANGERVEMVGHTNPRYGTLAEASDGLKLRYQPDPDHLDDYFHVTMRLTVTDGESSYAGASQEVTYKVSLLQDTSQVGFTTSFYDWPNTLRQYPDPIGTALAGGVLDQDPSSTLTARKAGFDGSGKEAAGRFAVTEGEVYLDATGEVDLYTRGNVYYNTCVAATLAGLPAATSAQSKVSSNLGSYNTSRAETRIKVYVVPRGQEAPADAGAYAAVIEEGAPLYVRAYVAMPYDCTCFYRIGYADGAAVREFGDDAFARPDASAPTTPAISDYPTEKAYSYTDPAVQATELFSDFESAGALTVRRVWDLDNDTALAAHNDTPVANMVDDGLSTHFHGRAAGSGYAAEFVFELAETATFNTVRYKGHADYADRGKVRDYEVYVGDDYDALLAAGPTSALCVSTGQAHQANDLGAFNLIDLGGARTGKYVRLVARSAHPSYGQYYYAFSDFKVGTMESISGLGEIETAFSGEGEWTRDDSLVNTRSAVMATSSGTGTKRFQGTGIIMYSLTAPAYGTMMVSLDGADPVEVDLKSDKTLGQQPVFWMSGLSADEEHTVTFYPKMAGADAVNVEYFEVKDGTPLGPKEVSYDDPEAYTSGGDDEGAVDEGDPDQDDKGDGDTGQEGEGDDGEDDGGKTDGEDESGGDGTPGGGKTDEGKDGDGKADDGGKTGGDGEGDGDGTPAEGDGADDGKEDGAGDEGTGDGKDDDAGNGGGADGEKAEEPQPGGGTQPGEGDQGGGQVNPARPDGTQPDPARPDGRPGGDPSAIPGADAAAGDAAQPSPAAPAVSASALAVGDRFVERRATYRLVDAGNSLVAYQKAPSGAASVFVPAIVVHSGRVYRVVRIAGSAFTGSSAKTVRMAAGVRAIERRAFYRARSLRTLVVGGSVSTIGAEAFAGCARLRNMTLGVSASSLGPSLFKGCRRLRTVTVRSTRLTTGATVRALAGSSIATVKVRPGNAASRAKYVKAYRKVFAKRNSGRSVSVR